MTTPILYESHMHTPLCKHARGEPEEYAAVAEQRGLKGIIVTCHNPDNDGWSPGVRMSVDEFDEYVEIVERARQAWKGRVDVRLGLESDYAPGMEPWLEELHSKADLHHVLGSVHPHIKDYKERYLGDDMFEYQKTYFEHLAMAAETGLFDTLSHPDLVKNVSPDDWDVQRLLEHIGACLDRIAAAGIAMELNTSGANKLIPEMNPGREILEEIQKRGIPIVLGADAHQPERVADAFGPALDLLADIGFTHVSIFLSRERHDIEIGAARRSLRE
ncbi:MAG: histidinol-phosphatase [Planctomycetota bacterium]|nr:histidinol-phosphatase [Planctomycetota bacterium]MDA1141013.1 histidinol-phosphatase [Planctomycetota bacterium]